MDESLLFSTRRSIVTLQFRSIRCVFVIQLVSAVDKSLTDSPARRGSTVSCLRSLRTARHKISFLNLAVVYMFVYSDKIDKIHL